MRYAIRVTGAEGRDMFVRHGPHPGKGEILTFPNRHRAQKFFDDMIAPGLDDDETGTIVLYGALNINDEKLA